LDELDADVLGDIGRQGDLSAALTNPLRQAIESFQ
jgi:hypothetical protein